MAFLDKGDQFLALIEGRAQLPDRDRHREHVLVTDDGFEVLTADIPIG